MKVSEDTNISMPIKNMAMIIFFIVSGAWFGFGDLEKIKLLIETEIPNIKKNDMTIQFHEERIIDIEQKQNGSYQ